MAFATFVFSFIPMCNIDKMHSRIIVFFLLIYFNYVCRLERENKFCHPLNIIFSAFKTTLFKFYNDFCLCFRLFKYKLEQ